VRDRRPAVAALLVLVATVSACSTVPSSSPTVQITQAPQRPAEQIGIEPLPPEAGATPEEIVRNYIDAAASNVVGHPVAREYLTPEAGESWSDEPGITIIDSDFATVTREESQVEVTATLVGTVDDRGVFSVGGTEVFAREFSLTEVDGEWRITDPPQGLVMLLPDFERLYDQVDLYFPDPTATRIVPDPRYLIGGDAQPTVVIDRLLAGPSPALAAGVLTPFAGVALRTSVEVQRLGAVVDLTGLSPDSGPQLSQISATLVWTLQQLGIRTVEVQVDGEPVRLDGVPVAQTVDDWPGVDPGAVPVDAVGHYLDNGVLRLVPDGRPAPGPAGAGAYALTSAAAVADPRSGELSYLAGVRSDAAGAALLAGPYGGELTTLLSGQTLSAPTVAATRTEAWVLRDGTSVVRIPFNGAPQAVSTPTLPGLGRATVLRLSPDGVRAVVVVDGTDGSTLHVGTVVRTEDGAVALRDLRAVVPTVAQVVDVAWEDGGSLLLLAGDAAEGDVVPYSVGVDGYGLVDEPTAGLPSQPTAVADAPGRLPLVSAAGTIWQLSGSTWTTLVRGQEPQPGTAPFYPL
jgi:hypothetical protein